MSNACFTLPCQRLPCVSIAICCASNATDGTDTETLISAEFDLKAASSCLACVISYLDLPNTTSHHGQWRLRHHDLSQYMKLDASAVKALNLMPNPLEMGGNKNMSLYGLLNHCKTAQGQRLLEMWLKQPLVNLHEIRKPWFSGMVHQVGSAILSLDSCIEQRQSLVEAFVEDASTRKSLQVSEHSCTIKLLPFLTLISIRTSRIASDQCQTSPG